MLLESTYHEARNIRVKKDGISEKSQIMILMRIFISHMTRIWFISPNNWIDLASISLEYLRRKYPILVGGFAGAELGDMQTILAVR